MSSGFRMSILAHCLVPRSIPVRAVIPVRLVSSLQRSSKSLLALHVSDGNRARHTNCLHNWILTHEVVDIVHLRNILFWLFRADHRTEYVHLILRGPVRTNLALLPITVSEGKWKFFNAAVLVSYRHLHAVLR